MTIELQKRVGLGPVAICGTGSAGLQHALAAKSSGVKELVIPKRKSRKTDLLEEGWKVVGDLRGAFASGARQAIIASDTAEHVSDSRIALEIGMDVLVEKPMASDVKGGHQILNDAKRLNREVYIGCCLRFSESLMTFREHLLDIGKVHAVEILCRSYLPDWRPQRDYKASYSSRKEEGGVLRDLIHEIDYAGWLFGWPVQIQATLRNTGRLGIDSEETADLYWVTGNGSSVSIHLDYLTRPHQRRMVAYGDNGILSWDGRADEVCLLSLKGKNTQWLCRQTREKILQSQLKAFVASQDGSIDKRLATGADGVRALAICDAARRSSIEGRKIQVDYGDL